MTYVDPLKELVLLELDIPDPNRRYTIDTGQPCYADFSAIFVFHRDGNYWEARFTIHVSKDGTPELKSVEVSGFRELKRYERELLKPTGTAVPVTTPGVQRWQLNLISEQRHELLKKALVAGVSSCVSRDFNGGVLTSRALKVAERKVNKKLSQRVVTNDFLRKVADVYSEAINNGLPDPIGEVIAFTDRSHRRSQEYVQMARDKHYLPATDKGVATGKAKPKRRKVKDD